MHSPWGILDSLSGSDPLKMQYLLEKVSWANIQMMAADRMKHVKKSEIVVKVSKEQLKEHRNRLKNG